MTNLFPQNWMSYLGIFFIFVRLYGLFLIVPVFSHRAIPIQVKVSLSVALSLALYPFLKDYLPAMRNSMEWIAFSVLSELVLGFLIGFIIYISFEAIHLAAQYIGYQVGFGTVGLIDPTNGASVSPLVPFTGWIALMLFLSMDLHHHMFRIFIASFQLTHQVKISIIENKPLLKLFVDSCGELFVIAIKIAAPFTLIVLASNAAIGILARMLPQMHVLLFSFPITILLGLSAMFLFSPEILASVENVLLQTSEKTMLLLRTF